MPTKLSVNDFVKGLEESTDIFTKHLEAMEDSMAFPAITVSKEYVTSEEWKAMEDVIQTVILRRLTVKHEEEIDMYDIDYSVSEESEKYVVWLLGKRIRT